MRSIFSKILVVIILAGFLLSFHPAQASYLAETEQSRHPQLDLQRADDVPFINPEMGDRAGCIMPAATCTSSMAATTCITPNALDPLATPKRSTLPVHQALRPRWHWTGQGHPHITYYDAGLTIGFCNDWKLKYAESTGHQWVIDVVDESCTSITHRLPWTPAAILTSAISTEFKRTTTGRLGWQQLEHLHPLLAAIL